MADPKSLGFSPVPGTKGNRYYPPEGYTGKVAEDGSVSRRQVRNVKARQHGYVTPEGKRVGYKNLAEYESQRRKLAGDDRFMNFVRMWWEREYPGQAFDKNGDRLNIAPKVYPGMESGIMQAYQAVPAKDWQDRKSAAYRNPNGPVAAFLVKLGYRQETWRYAVGDSPTASRA